MANELDTMHITVCLHSTLPQRIMGGRGEHFILINHVYSDQRIAPIYVCVCMCVCKYVT
jgi:hypothetical protein